MGFFGDTIGCVPAGSSVVGALLARIYQYILDVGLFALALIFFLWGVAQYIWQAWSGEGRQLCSGSARYVYYARAFSIG